MQIKKEIYNKIICKCPEAPPEVGGILGGEKGVISIFALDIPENSNAANRYMPNTENLNSIITAWGNNGIKFFGIFHTHFPYGYSLSTEDEQYIHQIMSAMPAYVKDLFFPVVIPGDGMASFKAIRENKIIRIEPDEIILI